ncbi:ANTAR domain-containing protein [Streptomyces sp. WMMB303]|uniref:ANTAR domain-containing protein n=1 Tax=Streptomyces sp. WMMB303 TaxID=3034154 RepID=UPI0023ED78C4|nr:ANTAR domain-containing protein [Streptomyces sp. WMMB303]MDF4254231.1 ANTAR domain-containing protein [Streptomyces sp. WMMB303]
MGTTGGLGTARAEVVRLPHGDGLWAVRAEGGVTDADHPALRAAVRPAVGCTAVVIDLALVPYVSPAGVRALAACARTLAADHRALLLAAPNERLRRALSAEGDFPTKGRPVVVHSVAEAAADRLAKAGAAAGAVERAAGAAGAAADCAMSAAQPAATSTGPTATAAPSAFAIRPAEQAAPPGELLRLRKEIRHLRAKARTHPLVSRAQGILEERYRLPDDRAAFSLLEASSQRFNVRLRTLATALVTTPGPRSYDSVWFPARERLTAPRLAFAPGLRTASANTAEVLSAVLRRSMEVVGTDMGNVQLVDPVTGDLRIEKHRGLDEDFVEFFDRVGEDGTACAQASQHVARVTVTDVATDPVFDEPAREAILAAGSRGCHSTPLVKQPSDRPEGVVSTHHERPVRALSAAEARALDEMAAQCAQWLEWYRHTVVLDALEDLHFAGSTWR